METKETITYRELARRVGDMILINKIEEVDQDMLYEGLENGSLYDNDDEQDGVVKDIFQFYAISDGSADYLKRISDELVFYSTVLDTYFWGITHFGISWDDVKIEVQA